MGGDPAANWKCALAHSGTKPTEPWRSCPDNQRLTYAGTCVCERRTIADDASASSPSLSPFTRIDQSLQLISQLACTKELLRQTPRGVPPFSLVLSPQRLRVGGDLPQPSLWLQTPSSTLPLQVWLFRVPASALCREMRPWKLCPCGFFSFFT